MRSRNLVGILLFSCAYLITVVYIFSLSTQAIANTAPTVDTITIATSTPTGSNISEINLLEDTTRNIYVRGAFSDVDGCGDVKTSGTLKIVFYHSAASNAEACNANNSDCYKGTYAGGECTMSGCTTGTETSANYECTIPLQYYALPSSTNTTYWKAIVTSTDGGSLEGSISATVEVNPLIAVTVSSVIDYGPVAIDTPSTSEKTAVVRNTGNATIDTELSGTDMICEVNQIPVEYQRYSLVSGTEYNQMTAMTTSSVLLQMNIFRQNSKDVYFRLSVPASLIPLRGTCAGTNTFIAVQDS